jgi:hypothetical protein
MVFFAITATGLKEALQLAGSSMPVWCSANAISEADYWALKASNLSRFVYALEGNTDSLLVDALNTIEEHHPNQRIWIEHVSAIHGMEPNIALNPDGFAAG